MKRRMIVLATVDEAVEFVNVTEKCEFPIRVIRQGDISEYNGKSLLSIIILLGWNLEVSYDGKNEELERFLADHRAAASKNGWIDYIMKQTEHTVRQAG